MRVQSVAPVQAGARRAIRKHFTKPLAFYFHGVKSEAFEDFTMSRIFLIRFFSLFGLLSTSRRGGVRVLITPGASIAPFCRSPENLKRSFFFGPSLVIAWFFPLDLSNFAIPARCQRFQPPRRVCAP